MARKSKETAGSRLKEEVLGVYVLDPRESALLERACGIADQLERIEAQLLAEDLSADGVANPLLKAQADLAGRFQRLLEGMDLPNKSERLRKSSTSRLAQKAASIRWQKEKASNG
jgi:hypothetical protein